MKTFIVRVYVPAVDEASGHEEPLRGLVEGPGTDSATPFRDERELVAILREATDSRTGDVTRKESMR